MENNLIKKDDCSWILVLIHVVIVIVQRIITIFVILVQLGSQGIQGIQGEKDETGLAWPIAIPSTAEITGQQDTSNVRVSDVNLLMKKIYLG